jgi:hypothetical protein
MTVSDATNAARARFMALLEDLSRLGLGRSGVGASAQARGQRREIVAHLLGFDLAADWNLNDLDAEQWQRVHDALAARVSELRARRA